MPRLECSSTGCSKDAVVKKVGDKAALCASCFTERFEQDVHNTIISTNLFQRGERVAIGASGGKDSTVLAFVMKKLNERYDYGLDLVLLSIDEGIKGYRDDSLKAVERNRVDYCMPLTVLSYKDLYGWTMDEIVSKIGKKNNCTYCGVFRRQALDRGAHKMGATKLLTGHNADDMAETVVMNVLRGDTARLQRCTNIITGEEGELPRAKPFKYCFEKDIVMYARLNKLDYFYTECKYAPDSFRANARSYVKDLERAWPQSILALIKSGESIIAKKEIVLPKRTNCIRCGYISSQSVCKACLMLEGLNSGCTDLGIKRKTKKVAVVDEGQAHSGCSGSCDCEQTPHTSTKHVSFVDDEQGRSGCSDSCDCEQSPYISSKKVTFVDDEQARSGCSGSCDCEQSPNISSKKVAFVEDEQARSGCSGSCDCEQSPHISSKKVALVEDEQVRSGCSGSCDCEQSPNISTKKDAFVDDAQTQGGCSGSSDWEKIPHTFAKKLAIVGDEQAQSGCSGSCDSEEALHNSF